MQSAPISMQSTREAPVGGRAISMQSVPISLPSEAISMQSTREAPFGWGGGSQSACNRLGRHLLGGGADRNQHAID